MKNYIRQAREEKGLSQKQLAEKIGVTAKTIAKWETGETSLTLDNLEKLTEEIGICFECPIHKRVAKEVQFFSTFSEADRLKALAILKAAFPDKDIE